MCAKCTIWIGQRMQSSLRESVRGKSTRLFVFIFYLWRSNKCNKVTHHIVFTYKSSNINKWVCCVCIIFGSLLLKYRRGKQKKNNNTHSRNQHKPTGSKSEKCRKNTNKNGTRMAKKRIVSLTMTTRSVRLRKSEREKAFCWKQQINYAEKSSANNSVSDLTRENRWKLTMYLPYWLLPCSLQATNTTKFTFSLCAKWFDYHAYVHALHHLLLPREFPSNFLLFTFGIQFP